MDRMGNDKPANEKLTRILTNQRTKAYHHGQDKVPGRSNNARCEHLHLAVQSSVALGTYALVFPGRLKVTTVAPVLAREPVALVYVHALHSALLIARTATKGAPSSLVGEE